MQQAPAGRGQGVIKSYRAKFDDLDLDDRTAARDLVTDLFHWANNAGVCLDDVIASARQVADEESNLG